MAHIVPEGYKSKLGVKQTQRAIKLLKDGFEERLCGALNLTRVSAPLYVPASSGLNDDLNGVERPVAFDLKEMPGEQMQIVQSLAKWKRFALKEYRFPVGEGLYTDMNAIRRDEQTDNLHSTYVDQWDWEKVITAQERNLDTLKTTVSYIHDAIYETAEEIGRKYPQLKNRLPEEIAFITTQELEDLYPELAPEARERAYVKEHGGAFFMQIGWPLRSGRPHDLRAPDYDDWSLNGDLVYYHKELDVALEISSMGVRVDPLAMEKQLAHAGQQARKSRPFHAALLAGELPLTIGGGIGQSRLCMLLLHKAHVGEVQVSVWPEEQRRMLEDKGIAIL
ncbi:Aspartate--ammonia ligase [uncultured Clostridium sp.]|nr:Aspartate--ammonia ligase [uncultured Clostridium sp.]